MGYQSVTAVQGARGESDYEWRGAAASLPICNAAALHELGVTTMPSMANFLFFTPPFAAESINPAWLREGGIIKPGHEAGYAQHLRVSTANCEDNDLFLEALARILAAQQTRSD